MSKYQAPSILPLDRPRIIISASEIGSFKYCRRAWWFKRVANLKPRHNQNQLQAGKLAHYHFGKGLLPKSPARLHPLLVLLFLVLVMVLLVILLPH